MNNIVRATANDAGFILNLRKSAVSAQKPGIWTSEEIYRAANAIDADYIKNEILSGQEFYIFDNIAFTSVKADYLAYLFILPQGQNKGLGSIMLNFAENLIKETGHPKSWLWAHTYAENFYARNDYNKTPEIKAPFGVNLHKFEKHL